MSGENMGRWIPGEEIQWSSGDEVERLLVIGEGSFIDEQYSLHRPGRVGGICKRGHEHIQ